MAARAGGQVPAPPVPQPGGGAGAPVAGGAAAPPVYLTGAQIDTDVNITEQDITFSKTHVLPPCLVGIFPLVEGGNPIE